MAYVISEPCIDVLDRACVVACPVDCIYEEAGQDRQLFINPDQCIDCGACEPVCPVEAILSEYDVPVEWEPFIELNALYFKDKTAVRLEINRRYPPRS